MQILPNHFPRPRGKKTRNTNPVLGQVTPLPIPHVIKDWKYLRPPCRKYPFFRAAPLLSPLSSDAALASWLADLCLLAYDKPDFVAQTLPAGGLQMVDFIHNNGIEVYLVQLSSTIVVVFRGTQIDNPLELLKDLKTDLSFKPQKSPHYPGKIHHGFEQALDQVWNPLSAIIAKHSQIHFTGHSLGGALALLAGLRTQHKSPKIHTFACPRVGDPDFAAEAQKYNLIRYEIQHDIIPRLPPRKFGFAHAGKRHVITSDGEISLQPEPKKDQTLKTNLKLNFFDHSPVLYATHLFNAMVQSNK